MGSGPVRNKRTYRKFVDKNLTFKFSADFFWIKPDRELLSPAAWTLPDNQSTSTPGRQIFTAGDEAFLQTF